MPSDNVNLHLSITVRRDSLPQAAELMAMGLQTAVTSIPDLVSSAVSIYDDNPITDEDDEDDEDDEPNLGVHIVGTGDLDVAGAIAIAKDPFGRRAEDT
jgi:ribonuclease PH